MRFVVAFTRRNEDKDRQIQPSLSASDLEYKEINEKREGLVSYKITLSYHQILDRVMFRQY